MIKGGWKNQKINNVNKNNKKTKIKSNKILTNRKRRAIIKT